MSDEFKKRAQTLSDGFRLHYFPNIPIEEPANSCARHTDSSEFQRLLFNDPNLDLACSEDDASPEIPETPAVDPGPSVDEIKEAAFQKGFLEGKRIGFESGSKKAEAVIDSLNGTLEQLINVRNEIHQEIEKEVTQLALAIARKIVCHEIKMTQETVACVAREALSRVNNPGKIKIKLNPDDLQFIKNTRSQFSRFLGNLDHIVFEAEESIQSGGCLIETDRGDIDARIEKQFQAIEESFQTQLKRSQQEIK